MKEMKEGDLGDVGRFLNRLLGLKILNQNMVSFMRPQIEWGPMCCSSYFVMHF